MKARASQAEGLVQIKTKKYESAHYSQRIKNNLKKYANNFGNE